MTEHEHRYVFLRQTLRDAPFDDREIVDLYYCNRCLVYKSVTVGHQPVYETGEFSSNSWFGWFK